MKKILMGSVILSIVLLAACTSVSTTVLPEGNSKYTVVATSSDEGKASEGAMDKANEVCKEKGKEAVVLKHNTHYQGGMDKETKDVVNTASKVAGSLSHTFIPGASEDNDYKTTVQFRCE